MKKLLLISFLGFIFICGVSCKKKHSVEFEYKDYTIHYDDTIQLNIKTTEDNSSMFNFTSQDENVVKVNKDGLASGVFVGETTITVSNGEISDKCNITVEPYEKLFITPLLNLKGLTKEQIKFIEARELKAEYNNALCYYPFEGENGIDSLKFSIVDSLEVTETVYFKNNVTNDAILLYLKERYLERTNDYLDHSTGGSITYEMKNGNENARLVYSFK